MGKRRGLVELDETVEEFPAVLQNAVNTVCGLGFSQAGGIGEWIAEGFLQRGELMV